MMKRLLNLISCLGLLVAATALAQEGSKTVLAVSDGKFSFPLHAYAPASFVLE